MLSLEILGQPLHKQVYMTDPSPQKIGKGMIAAAWIIGLLLLTQFFAHWQKEQINPNTEPQSTVNQDGRRDVILQRNRSGHYVTVGFINGQPVTLMLDTGATDVVIPESIAKSLGLNRLAYSQASTANGTIPVYKTRIDRLSIGNIQLHDVPASINPAMSGKQAILLGMSALKQLEMVQKNQTLTLIQN